MALIQQRYLGKRGNKNPFDWFICDGCGVRLGKHWVFRNDSLHDLRTRNANGKLFCRRDNISYAGSYHQRQLRRLFPNG